MKLEADPLKLPAGLRIAAERLAEEDGVTLNDWIASAVAQKIAAEHVPGRDGVERFDDLHETPARVTEGEPDPDDGVPPGWESAQRA